MALSRCPLMSMTHAPETGTENPYQKTCTSFLQVGVSYESVSIFSGTKIWYGVEQCSTPCRKLVQVFWYQFSVPVSGACVIGFSHLCVGTGTGGLR